MNDVSEIRDICQEIIDKNHEIKTLLNYQITISSNLYSSILKLLDEEYRRGFNDGVASEKSQKFKETETKTETVKENTDKVTTENKKNKESKNEVSDEVKFLMAILGLLD